MVNRLILIILVFLINVSCKNQNSDFEVENNTKTTELSHLKDSKENRQEENFNMFILKFISDSIFRYSRIKFPLKGYNFDAEITKRDYYIWNKEDWDFYSIVDMKYKSDENIINEVIPKDSLMVWRLYKESSGYDIKYEFKLNENKWYLNYYSYKNF
jgi:hypothetical protein